MKKILACFLAFFILNLRHQASGRHPITDFQEWIKVSPGKMLDLYPGLAIVIGAEAPKVWHNGCEIIKSLGHEAREDIGHFLAEYCLYPKAGKLLRDW